MAGPLSPTGLFVTGTDTGVGKTVLAAAVVAALRAAGVAVAAVKPVITGLEEPPAPGWPHDHELLARVAGSTAAEVSPFRYGPAVSPDLAGALAGSPLHPERLRAAVARAGEGSEVVVVEGVGGLLVPLAEHYDVRRLAAEVALPAVIVARPGLGTINHTLLTLEAARAGGLEVAAVALNPWPVRPSTIELSNRETISRLGRVDVAPLPFVERPTDQALAAAGAELPLARWFPAHAAALASWGGR